MNTWLTMDFVAKRYGLLPSQVLKSGNTLDIQIANLAVSYENYLHKEVNNQTEGKISSDLTEEQMKSMLNAVRIKNA